MNQRFKPRLDILPAAQRQQWAALARVSRLGFVLYGGTAVALRLGHRQSVDFDFFSDETLSKDGLLQELPFLVRATVLQDQPNIYTALVTGEPSSQQSVKLSFFGGLEFGRVSDPQVTDDGVLQVASLDDLMATKLKVILQRIEAKDYSDIAAMIQAGVNLSKGLAAARAMYGTTFQPSESLKALVYFKGGDLAELSADNRATLINAAAAVQDLPRVSKLATRLSLPFP